MPVETRAAAQKRKAQLRKDLVSRVWPRHSTDAAPPPSPSPPPIEALLHNNATINLSYRIADRPGTPEVTVVNYAYYKQAMWVGKQACDNLDQEERLCSPESRREFVAGFYPMMLMPDDSFFPQWTEEAAGVLTKAAPDLLLRDGTFNTKAEWNVFIKGPCGRDVYPPHFQSSFRCIGSQFLREIHILEMLHRSPHPNIVRFLGCCVDGGYIVAYAMEKVPLRLDRYDPSDPRYANLDPEIFLAQLESAVRHMHSLSVAHNNIHPDNIMVTAEGLPVLIGFASSAPFGQERLRMCRAGWSPHGDDEEGRSNSFISSKANDEYALDVLRERFAEDARLRMAQ